MGYRISRPVLYYNDGSTGTRRHEKRDKTPELNLIQPLLEVKKPKEISTMLGEPGIISERKQHFV